MDFEIDRETFSDLEIFSGSSGSGGIHSLFNKTRTLGARDLLIKIMKEPLSDVKLLTDRKDAIEFFFNYNIQLEITHNQLDLVEHYLNLNKRYLRNNALDALFGHISNKVNITPTYYIITTGIKNIIQLLRSVASFISSQCNRPIPHLLTAGSKLELLHDSWLMKIAASEKELTCFEVHDLDRFFRKTKIKQVRELLRFIYEMDVFESAAEVVKNRGWCFPIYNEYSNRVKLTGFFHPEIDEPVRNNLNAGGEEKLVFLTGPNMAGKSSLLKSLGLAIYLSHIGFPVPAERMETPIFNGLITTINLSDNITGGLSHYYSEIKRIKYMALAILEKNKLFVIIDELFRGTNPKDSYDASLMIITALAQIPNCVFMISTHHSELSADLKDIPKISFKYMDSNFNDKPEFSYQLKNGVSHNRSGMYFIENEGVLDILQRAGKIEDSMLKDSNSPFS